MTITAETYTTANGSNMDEITYKDTAALGEIIANLRNCYDNWDYAILSGDDGEIIATVYNDSNGADADGGDLVDVSEAAELLGVSRQRVHQLLQAGQLEGRKVGKTWYVYRHSVDNRLNA
ncbi:MAG: helix-turn-helix domain-containing protein [Eggerthellaceae bacterium]|nr:helix-turn-helix domain-containing protein [Eggerthellaceae bacterium]